MVVAGWGLVLLLAAGCAESATEVEVLPAGAVVPSPTEVTLPLGEEVRVGDALRLVFTRVVEDSRCPVDVTCVWEGNAVVEIGVALGSGPTFPVQLNSTLEPRSAEWNGVRLTYLELLPRPVSEGPAPEDFTLRIRVEAAS